VKKLIRLVLFFSLSFTVIVAAAAGFRFLILRVSLMCRLPPENEALLTTIIAAVRWALSAALYGSILLSLSYAARKSVFTPVAVIVVIILSLSFSFGVLLGLEQIKLSPHPYTARVIGGEGVILTQANTSVVLLRGPQEPRGPRVTVFAGRPLLYQAEPSGPNNSVLALPPLPLEVESPWLLKSIAIDLRLNAEQLQSRLASGIIPFFIYAGALVFFLVSLGFIFKLSVWPLANVFFGFLIFRLIMGVETFFNSQEIQDTFKSFIGNRFPVSLAVPSIFCVFGILVTIYSLLVYLAKRRGREEDYQ
jgi:hypothetical protein